MQPPCARLVRTISPHYTAQAATYDTFARSSTRIKQAQRSQVKKNEASGERRPRRTVCSHDCQRASLKPSVHAVALCSSCAHRAPFVLPRSNARRPRRTLRSHDYHLKFLKRGLGRKESAAYATLARLSTRIEEAKRACCRLVLALCESCPPLYCTGGTRGDHGIRYARTIVNAHWIFCAAVTPGH
jgi:hypothetical protein